MKHLNQQTIKETEQNIFVDFTKASPEAIDSILTALNSEVDAAIAEKRFPSLEGAFLRLGTTSRTMM